jgi:hypothetical protein
MNACCNHLTFAFRPDEKNLTLFCYFVFTTPPQLDETDKHKKKDSIALRYLIFLFFYMTTVKGIVGRLGGRRRTTFT